MHCGRNSLGACELDQALLHGPDGGQQHGDEVAHLDARACLHSLMLADKGLLAISLRLPYTSVPSMLAILGEGRRLDQ